jgi:hypothetical protein
MITPVYGPCSHRTTESQKFYQRTHTVKSDTPHADVPSEKKECSWLGPGASIPEVSVLCEFADSGTIRE